MGNDWNDMADVPLNPRDKEKNPFKSLNDKEKKRSRLRARLNGTLNRGAVREEDLRNGTNSEG